MNSLKKHKKGFSLIKIILGFVIAAILLVAVMVLYIKVSENNKINRLKEEVVLVRETGVKPEIFNTYKGNVCLEPSSAISETDGVVIQVTFKNAPQTACDRAVRDLGKSYYFAQVYGKILLGIGITAILLVTVIIVKTRADANKKIAKQKK